MGSIGARPGLLLTPPPAEGDLVAVALDLGGPPAEASVAPELLPTGARLARFRTKPEWDNDLVALWFQYGRYLLLSSSREGSLPANLQGIWNDHFRAPWNADFHTNINVQMNYWHAGPAALSETELPLMDLIDRVIDEGSFFEIKKLFAGELITGLARLDGRVIGLVANQPRVKGGVLFTDTADKAARFIWLCDAFRIPLLFLADVPGFMIGSKVEREGIIRHGAKMISAVSSATVPKISVVVRKAYGAGLYAMAGPAFEPDCVLALPSAMIAVMGPEAAINAVYANKIAELPEEDRAAFVAEKRSEYQRDIDVYRLASELVIDGIVAPETLREELVRRFDAYADKTVESPAKRRSVLPV